MWDPKIKTIDGDIHREFLKEAYSHAWLNSEDPVTKTGALIISYRNGLPETASKVYGANHFPEGLKYTKEQVEDRNWRLDHIIHAEPAAIYAAARHGVRTEGSTMYMPWVPCTPCAKAIVDSGIKTLVGHKSMIMKTPERWWESTDHAISILGECGVNFCMYDGNIGGVRNLFSSEVWKP
jgi:dCMP deaminase